MEIHCGGRFIGCNRYASGLCDDLRTLYSKQLFWGVRGTLDQDGGAGEL
ncbi:MAG TPA: hypothetical protein PLM14_01205 [Candidatus Hydrogenedentes bacterium]|nr:hypothetical protein [Candidatus Hydrogenedentota bacterium]HQE81581.1 hypothetical protein [Candidatus Hydrogenedentota bacterium]HQH51498.1 hypothetical protein [Candidatus Hydrogenedentota bacterium]HQM49669.1 hypothetical protein [Candidatus Hydrogenedentota bacterium]